MDRKIKTNMIKCNYCGDIIVSENRHDFKFCSCGKVAVDGGTDYLKRSYTNSTDDFTELTEYIDWKCLTYVSHYEGNGRTQRIYIEQLCMNNGRFEIDFTEVTKEEMIAASIRSANSSNDMLEALIVKCLIKI